MSKPPEHIAALLGHLVQVTSPTGAVWTGELVGYLGQPSVTIDMGDRQLSLPAGFTIEELPVPDEPLVRLDLDAVNRIRGSRSVGDVARIMRRLDHLPRTSTSWVGMVLRGIVQPTEAQATALAAALGVGLSAITAPAQVLHVADSPAGRGGGGRG